MFRFCCDSVFHPITDVGGSCGGGCRKCVSGDNDQQNRIFCLNSVDNKLVSEFGIGAGFADFCTAIVIGIKSCECVKRKCQSNSLYTVIAQRHATQFRVSSLEW
jgi:hypothetical protein